MHENLLSYPEQKPDASWGRSRRQGAERHDAHYAFVNITSSLAADLILWNSAHNRDSFLDKLPAFLRSFPDCREHGLAEAIAARSRVLPVGLDLASLDAGRPAAAERGRHAPRVLWNHRWEHDKAPEVFFAALERLAASGAEFEAVVLGEAFGTAPRVFDEARERLGGRLVHMGYAADRAEYARWLWSCDVVVSTARHEFFGTAVCEAVHCGCVPVLPSALAYPEIVPSQCHDHALYRDFDDLVGKLSAALTPGAAERAAGWLVPLRERIARLDWSVLAPEYDAVLAGLHAAGPLPPLRAGLPS
jgi:glycosyltransferase involved in cell wall biosynthesis